MADIDHMTRLRAGVPTWNVWRSENPAVSLDLAKADLARADLARADLWRADLAKANLARANLTGADLTGADLPWANLTGADLTGANLTGADLTGANLTRADLAGAKLRGADLARADLARADLTKANLARANLTGADLTGVNLAWANLWKANLVRANLTGTVLDPDGIPNGGRAEDEWETDGEYLIGYRSRNQPYQAGPDYENGVEYVAPVFSVCPETDCHPGLYVCREVVDVEDKPVIRVRFQREDLHSVRVEHRVRRFMVLGELAAPVEE